MTDNHHDVVIVGGGPGGYVAALRAAQLGLSTALVERAHLGGVCLNWGCIPTKALLHASDLLREMRSAAAYGIDATSVAFDLGRMVARSRATADQLAAGVTGLLRRNKVPVHMGSARIEGADRVRVARNDGGTEVLEADAIVIATGASPRALPGIVPDGDFVWTARDAMTPKSVPKELLVIGAGAIGIEFASFYESLGTRVTVVELLPRILPTEDDEVSAFVRKALERRGVTILTGARVVSLVRGRGARIATQTGEVDIACERVILAVGVEGNTDGLGLEDAGVAVERGFVPTDAVCATGVEGIYAIGDVAGAPCLAHKASHEGVLVAESIAGERVHPLARQRIPACTYAHPQVASVGLTERAAAASGRTLRVGRFPLVGNGKAVALGDTHGFVKTVFDAVTGELLGAHLVGPGVTELVQGFAIAMTGELTEAELMATVFPHPTLSEAMHESVLAAYSRALHV
jgi:dihydrolipoamide dehydrogenase